MEENVVLWLDCNMCSTGVLTLYALCAGRQVIRGNASKAFQPFLLPEDMKGSLEEQKSKLMVGFDPLKCFVTEIEASRETYLHFLLTDVLTVCT